VFDPERKGTLNPHKTAHPYAREPRPFSPKVLALKQAKFLAALRKGGHIYRSCVAAKAGRRTVSDWREQPDGRFGNSTIRRLLLAILKRRRP
jgi:hypothetical protein